MTIMLFLIVTLAALLALLLGAIAYAQAAGRVQVMRRVHALDVCESHKLAALAYFDRVAKRVTMWRALWDHIRAPFVLFFPLRKLPWEANALPPKLAYWDNNVSINGDGWGWLGADGKWRNDCQKYPPPAGVTPVPYTSLDYGGDAYYAPGHHPRSWRARFVWLAFRNVASKPLKDAGPLIDERPTLLAGAPRSGAYAPGYALYWNGKEGEEAAYQYHAIDKFGPLVLWTNVGAKLGDAYSWPEIMPTRAMLTCTWRAFKWGAK